MRITCFENQPIRITAVLDAIESDWLTSNKRETQAFRIFFPFSFLSFEYSNTLIQSNGYTVVMETLGIKYGTKKIQRRATEIVNHMVPYI